MKNNKKLKFSFEILIIIIIGFFCSIYFYSQLIHIAVPIHSDDVGMLEDFNSIINLGEKMSFLHFINPLDWLFYILFLIFGNSEFTLHIFFTLRFFICICLAMYLALCNKMETSKNWYILPVFLFIVAMPGNMGTASIHALKFHIGVIIRLLILLIMLDKINKHTINKIILLTLLSSILILENDILLFVTVWIPIMIYIGIYLLQKNIFHRNIRTVIILSCVLLILGKIIFGDWSYSGYGVRNFSSIYDLVHNIGVGISGLLTMFNIPIAQENIIQFNTIFYLARLFLLILSFVLSFKIIKKGISEGLESVDIVCFIASISIYVSIVVYLLSGYQVDDISVRYISCIYYLLPIVLCRQMVAIFEPKKELLLSFNGRINMISVLFVCSILLFLQPIGFQREKNNLDLYAERIEEEYELQYGLGGFWSANVVSALTEGNNHLQAVEFQNNRVVPYLNVWGYYRSGMYQFNYFVEDKENDYNLNKTNIIDIYGQPQEILDLEEKVIYKYNYDIRYKPVKVNFDDTFYINYGELCESKANEILIPVGQSIYVEPLSLAVGKSRLIIEGANFKDGIETSLSAPYNEQKIDLQLISLSNKRAVYEINTSGLYQELKIAISNNGNEDINFESLEMHTINLSNNVELKGNGKGEFDCEAGTYDVTLLGDDIKSVEAEILADGEKIEVKNYKTGRKRHVYTIQLEKASHVTILYKNAEVYECGYETPFELLPGNSKDTNLYYKIGNGISSTGNSELKGVLKNKENTYGPYVKLEAGTYKVTINGDGLLSTTIWFNEDAQIFDNILKIYESDDKMAYILTAERNTGNMEILVRNDTDLEVEVSSYVIEPMDAGWSREYTINSGLYINEQVEELDSAKCELKKDGLIYGPYINLPAGDYEVEIWGENLEGMSVSLGFDNGTKKVNNLELISNSNNQLIYKFSLNQSIKAFEVLLENKGQNSILFENYIFRKK